MYLINVHSFQLEEFYDERAPQYAILSHRWEEEEVNFQDMQNLEVARTKKGFLKIRESCKIAEREGYEYMWIDTCCIDKKSSAELSEAINSMYQWYKSSAVCYVFLSEVCAHASSNTVREDIRSSAWFTRGWTLQELLAPTHIDFYNQRWECLGTKHMLGELLTRRTGIPVDILEHKRSLSECSIAQRMSWASQRITTRLEDVAYCLLGIFDVAMPLLYGEKEKAFFRLQEEILKKSHDHSLFAWPMQYHDQPGLLANSPAAFAGCQNVVTRPSLAASFNIRQSESRVLNRSLGEKPYSMTNRGLSIRMTAIQVNPNTYMVRLNCADETYLERQSRHSATNGLYGTQCLAIYMRRLEEDDLYARVQYRGDEPMPAHGGLRRVPDTDFEISASSIALVQIINMNIPQAINRFTDGHYESHFTGFQLEFQELPSLTHEDPLFQPGKQMNVQPGKLLTFQFVDAAGESKLVKLGYDFYGNPLCFIDITKELQERALANKRSVPERISFGSAQLEPGRLKLKGDRREGLIAGLEKNVLLHIQRKMSLDPAEWTWHVRFTHPSWRELQ